MHLDTGPLSALGVTCVPGLWPTSSNSGSPSTHRSHYARARFSLSCPGHGESRPWGWRVCHLLGQAALIHEVPALRAHLQVLLPLPFPKALSGECFPSYTPAAHLAELARGCPGRTPVRCTHSEVPVVGVGMAALAGTGCHVRQVDTGTVGVRRGEQPEAFRERSGVEVSARSVSGKAVGISTQ